MPRGYWPGRRNWTEAEYELLDDLLDRGSSDSTIARSLGRTVAAIRLKRARRHLPSRTERTLTANRVRETLGIGSARPIRTWIQRRWLSARKVGALWVIREEALLDFLATPDHWHLWDPSRITDPTLREWAEELRGGVRYLTVREVAARVGVSASAAYNWVSHGRLRAVRRGNWLVRESDLDGFVPPCDRPRHPRHWTDLETRLLLDMRLRGDAWEDIAQALRRSERSVYRRYCHVVAGG